jgi:hypothetical protein
VDFRKLGFRAQKIMDMGVGRKQEKGVPAHPSLQEMGQSTWKIIVYSQSPKMEQRKGEQGPSPLESEKTI